VSGGVYVDYLAGDEWAARRGCIPSDIRRPAMLKRRYDLDNVFRLNSNIAPDRGGNPA